MFRQKIIEAPKSMREQRIISKSQKPTSRGIVAVPRIPGGQVVATLGIDGKVYPTNSSADVGAINTHFQQKQHHHQQHHQQQNQQFQKQDASISASGTAFTTAPTTVTVLDMGKQLLSLARDGDIVGVHNSLSHGAPFTSDWLGMSALHFATLNNHYGICELLLKAGINKDVRTKVDRTALHLACYNGNERIAELLLSKGCLVNPRDMLRMTPLHWAVEKKHKSIVRLLLKYKAEVEVVSKFERTPIGLAVLTEQADILEELEAYRKAERTRKMMAEREKETSLAVNSIMDPREGASPEPPDMHTVDGKLTPDEEIDAEVEGNVLAAQIKMEQFDPDEDAVLDNSTVDMLKSHGISMMQDDVNTSQDLLTTALKNGRQLVISEGGKLVLNQAKQTPSYRVVNPNRNATPTSNISGKANNNNIRNQRNHNILPVRLKSGASPAFHKVLSNNIVKLKDSLHSSGNVSSMKNKNIRIISLQDFKKMYGNSTLKNSSLNLSSPRLVKLLSEDTSAMQVEENGQSTSSEDAGNPLTDIIEKLPNGNESRSSSAQQKSSGTISSGGGNGSAGGGGGTGSGNSSGNGSGNASASGANAKYVPISTRVPVTRIDPPPKRVVQVCQIPITAASSSVSNAQQSVSRTSIGNSSRPIGPPVPVAMSMNPINPNYIYRQFAELRRQHEQLRRKLDAVVQENIEMRERLDRVESLMLVERNEEFIS